MEFKGEYRFCQLEKEYIVTYIMQKNRLNFPKEIQPVLNLKLR